MRSRLLLLITFMLIGFGQAQAQNGQIWYWAFDDDTGRLLAYTADGQVNILADGGVSRDDFVGWRWGDHSALAAFYLGDEYELFHLTSDSMKPILLADGTTVSGDYQVVAGYNSRYAALVSVGGDTLYNPGLLVNLDSDSAESLTGVMPRFSGSSITAVFSSDGRYLRYASQENAESKKRTIRERDLQSGKERAIYQLDDLALLTTDSGGDQWVYSGVQAILFIQASGEVQQQGDPQQDAYLITHEHLMLLPLQCPSNCPVSWQPVSGGDATIFTAPDSPFISVLAAPDDEHLIVLSKNTYWLLSSDGGFTKIGDWQPTNVLNPPQASVSPDGERILALTQVAENTGDPVSYGVWDTPSQKYIMKDDPARPVRLVQIFYGAGGFIVGEDTKHYRLYRESDKVVSELPDIEKGMYFDVLADGSVLCVFFEANGKGEKGIYRYDPVAKTFTLIAAGAAPANVRALSKP